MAVEKLLLANRKNKIASGYPHNRFTWVAYTFSIPKFWLFGTKSEFFNSHACSRQPPPQSSYIIPAYTTPAHAKLCCYQAGYRVSQSLLMSRRSAITLISIALLTLGFSGCGGGNGSGTAPSEVTSVSVSPATAQVSTGQTQLFTAQVSGTGAFNNAVTWSVNGVTGGNSTNGTIVGGAYTAPAAVPSPSNVTITATSVKDPTISGNSAITVVASSAVTSVSVNPMTAQVPIGQTQLFTAQVSGTGAFNNAVTWSVNGVTGGNNTYGMISAGQYTAPATVPNPSNVTIKATSVQDPTISGNSTATVVGAGVVLNSITPSSGSAGDVLTIDATFIISPIEIPQMIFSGVNGTSVSASVQIATGLTVAVPFGTTSGPVYMSVPPQPGSGASTVQSNSVPFTRLPNLLLHAPNKDLSSGETAQFQYVLLGATTPNVVTWKSDSGTINSSGLFTAPAVSSESYARVTGCLQGTDSCDTVLLRIVPFLITPTDPIVGLGDMLQLNAVQGSSTLSPTWSVLAGGGTINSAGVYTAPTTTAGAGGVPVQAQKGSTTELAEVAVTGAFPGLVNRVYDYANFNIPEPPEARFVESVAVSGNRAYALSIGNPFKVATTYQALNVYDITNPDQPVWIDAVEAAAPGNLFVYGSNLFSINSGEIIVYSLTTQVPTLTQAIPLPAISWVSSLHNGIFYFDYSNSATSVFAPLPIDVYNTTTGTAIHTHYDLPAPASGAGQVYGVSGNGNTIYVSWLDDSNGTPTYIVATYNASQSPPALLSTISTTSTTEFHLQVVGNLLFADSVVYDISNVIPVQVATVPVPLGYVWGTEGNNILVGGEPLTYGASANYVVLNTSSPSAPVVQANVVDFPTADIFNPQSAAWANNTTFYTADGTGGIAVYDVSAAGGPAVASAQEILSYTYAQALNGQTLYCAAQYAGAADLAVLDVSGGTPVLEGSLYYDNNSPSAVQASGTTVFFGLSNYLKVINASTPSAPVEIGSVTVPVSALALLGNDLFVSTTDGRLMVYDVTAPASPNQLASISMPVASTMSISGPLLLVAAGQGGLLVYNISNPSSPALQSQYLPSNGIPVWDAAATVSGVVILAADSDGIIILDLANPSSPQVLNELQLPFLNPFPAPSSGAGILTAFSLAYQNGLTYVGTGNFGAIFVYDTSVPADPRLMGLNVVSPDALDIVSVITLGQNNLYSAVIDELIQLDNTIPQNSIELYFPPAALSNATTITGDLRTAKTRRDIISATAKRMFANRNRSGAAGRR